MFCDSDAGCEACPCACPCACVGRIDAGAGARADSGGGHGCGCGYRRRERASSHFLSLHALPNHLYRLPCSSPKVSRFLPVPFWYHYCLGGLGAKPPTPTKLSSHKPAACHLLTKAWRWEKGPSWSARYAELALEVRYASVCSYMCSGCDSGVVGVGAGAGAVRMCQSTYRRSGNCNGDDVMRVHGL